MQDDDDCDGEQSDGDDMSCGSDGDLPSYDDLVKELTTWDAEDAEECASTNLREGGNGEKEVWQREK